MGFAHLHVHDSSGSRLDSVVDCIQLATRAQELGHKYLAVSNHGSCASWYEHQQACDKTGVVPVFGLEQYIIPDDELITLNDAGKRIRCKNNHIVLLAKNYEGLQNIMHLNYISMADTDHFYYNNHTTFSELFKYSEGVICGTACMMSPFSNALKENNPEKAEALFKQFLNVFKENFYVEVQINELTKQIGGLEHGQYSTNAFLMELADKYGVPKVITGDVHYLNKEDYKLQDISLAMREKRTVNDPGFTLEAKTLFYHDVDDYKFFNKQFNYNYNEELIDEMCNNAEYIASLCKCRIPDRTKMIFPSITNDDDYELEKDCIEALKKMFNTEDYKNVPEEYRKRFESELEVLKRKGFSSYVMVLADIFKFCTAESIPVGFARGSGAGSLVLYLMGVTKINPLQKGFNLLFERFLNNERSVDCVVNYFN